jgi:hypothetical protein
MHCLYEQRGAHEPYQIVFEPLDFDLTVKIASIISLL